MEYSQVGEVFLVRDFNARTLQVNKLAFFVIGKIANLFGLWKKEIINGQEFQRTTKAVISLENNCLPYVGLLI